MKSKGTYIITGIFNDRFLFENKNKPSFSPNKSIIRSIIIQSLIITLCYKCITS